MAIELTDSSVTPVPIRLSPEVRDQAQKLSASLGLSLESFVERAVEEQVSLARHQEWLKTRRPMTDERRREFLAILDKPRGEPIPGDELPPGYERIKY